MELQKCYQPGCTGNTEIDALWKPRFGCQPVRYYYAACKRCMAMTGGHLSEPMAVAAHNRAYWAVKIVDSIQAAVRKAADAGGDFPAWEPAFTDIYDLGCFAKATKAIAEAE